VVFLTFFLCTSSHAVEFGEELDNLKAEAATHGVKDLEATLCYLSSATTTSADALSDGAQYVQVMMQLRSLANMEEDKGMYPLLMPRNTGIHVHNAVSDENKAKLKRRKAVLETNLGLGLGEGWAEASQEYRAALKELSTHHMQQNALVIENQVFKRSLLIKSMPRVESGHNAKKGNVRLTAMGKNIGDSLKNYFTWAATESGTPAAATPLTAQILQDAFNRNFPWNGPGAGGATLPLGANGSDSAQRHFAMRYHAARNQLHRTKEEVGILKKEVVRLFNWCEERQALVASKIEWFDSKIEAKLEANRAATITAMDAYENTRMIHILKGKRAVHTIEHTRLKCIHLETVERLSCKLPR